MAGGWGSKVFDIGEEEHDIILQKVHESKVSDGVSAFFSTT